QADRGVGLVHVLPARAARAVGVDAQVLVPHVDLDLLLDVGEDEDRGEGGVAAGVGVEGRDADQTVDARLGLEVAVRIGPLDREGGALQACALPGLELHQLGAEAAALAPAEVQAQQHLGPILRLEPAGARVDLDDRVAGVVLAAEEPAQLELREPVLHLLDLRDQLAERVRRALLRELEEDLGLVDPFALPPPAIDGVSHVSRLAADGLRLLGVLPEVVRTPGQAISSTCSSAWSSGPCQRMRPSGSTTAEMPVLATRTSGTRFSTARSVACARCW